MSLHAAAAPSRRNGYSPFPSATTYRVSTRASALPVSTRASAVAIGKPHKAGSRHHF